MKIELYILLFWLMVVLYLFLYKPAALMPETGSAEKNSPQQSALRRGASRRQNIVPALGEVRRNVSRRDLTVYKKKFEK